MGFIEVDIEKASTTLQSTSENGGVLERVSANSFSHVLKLLKLWLLM